MDKTERAWDTEFLATTLAIVSEFRAIFVLISRGEALTAEQCRCAVANCDQFSENLRQYAAANGVELDPTPARVM